MARNTLGDFLDWENQNPDGGQQPGEPQMPDIAQAPPPTPPDDTPIGGVRPPVGGAPPPPDTTNPEGGPGQTPRERRPDAQPNTPGPDVRRNDGQPTPSMPQAPAPIAAGPPMPFQPIPPAGTDEWSTAPQVSRVVPGGPAASSSALFGKAGGLLGGGLGVADQFGGASNPTAFLAQLLKAIQNGEM